MACAGSAKGETHVVVWQDSWRDDYLRWLCGLANADGGTLVIGGNDKGERLPPKALTLKRAELVERLRPHDHHAKIATADDGCAVTSESWLPIQLVVGERRVSRALWESYSVNVVLIIASDGAPKIGRSRRSWRGEGDQR